MYPSRDSNAVGAANSIGVERHQQDAMKGTIGCVDHTCHFLLAQHLRQMPNLLRIWRFGNTSAFLQHLNIEEAQSCQPLRYGVRGQLPPSE
jgi:hypothetical protein